MPDDDVACCDARGHITVNGKPLDEPYLFPGDAPSGVRFKVTVPRGICGLRGIAGESHLIRGTSARLRCG